MRTLALISLALALAGCASATVPDRGSVANDPTPQKGVSSAVAGDQINTPRAGAAPVAPVPGTPPNL